MSKKLRFLVIDNTFSWIGGRGQFGINTAVENSYGLRKHCRIWEGGIPCLFLRWSSAAPAVRATTSAAGVDLRESA
jgi:hypothetical protein